MRIRRATQNDAEAIATIHTASWQAIYRGHFPDDYLDNIDVQRRSETWRKIAQEASDELVVVEDGDSIVGFLHLAGSRDHDAEPLTDEITSIYLVPGCWRKGYGRTLVDWAYGRSRARGASRITLWALEANGQARQFYDTMGFQFRGKKKSDRLKDGFEFTEVRYEYDL